MYAGACDVIHIVIHIAEPGKRERSESEKASGLIQASSLLPIAAQSQLQDQWRGECHAQARLKIVKIVKIVKAGASQLGKKHPARLLGRHARTRQSSAGARVRFTVAQHVAHSSG